MKKHAFVSDSGFTLIEIMIVVAIIGLLATIAVPNLHHAIVHSRAQACAINRKNIDAAKMQWALANVQPLSVIPTEQDLFGSKQFIDHRPNCPAGGRYDLKAVEEYCTCDFGGHVNQTGSP